MALVDRPFVAGLAMILAVCVIWTFSSVLVQRVEHERVSPVVLTYACNALFVVYLVPRLARRRGDAAPRARRETTVSPARNDRSSTPYSIIGNPVPTRLKLCVIQTLKRS